MPLEQWLIIYLKKIFMEKEKKINIFTDFSISHKSSVKTFIKWIVNHCPKGPVSMTLLLNSRMLNSRGYSLCRGVVSIYKPL